MNTRICALVLVIACCAPSSAQTFDDWVGSQVDAVLAKQQVGENGKGVDRQRESPSTDPRSTSLVDQSSATDFLSVAANVIPVTPGLSQLIGPTGSSSTGTSAAGSTTVTASLYALLAAFNKVGPTDPKFYGQHTLSRRFSLTIGTAVSNQNIDNTDKPAVVYGGKVLLINQRELYTHKNLEAIKVIQKAVSAAAAKSFSLKAKIKEIMFAALRPGGDEKQREDFALTAFSEANFSTTLNALPPEALKQIQSLIESSIDPFLSERKTLEEKYDQISKGMQMSVSYTADIRDAQGNNGHRTELIFDYGLSDRINWTVNASGDYTDRKSAVDSKGGRFATSFQGDLTKANSAWGRTPLRLSFSGEAKWLSSQKPQYTFESKLSIPLVSGVDLPIVYRYANRIAQIDQTNSEARLGLSIDISRLAQTLK
jgi:hypothetical protein